MKESRKFSEFELLKTNLVKRKIYPKIFAYFILLQKKIAGYFSVRKKVKAGIHKTKTTLVSLVSWRKQ